MADFCKQCSEAHFGKDYKNFYGLSEEFHTNTGFFVQVLCEGCGSTFVDHLGKCVGKCDCYLKDCTNKGDC